MHINAMAIETVEHCLADGVFVINASTGQQMKANGSSFAASLQADVPAEHSRHSLLIVAGAKEARCLGDFDEHNKLGKAEWSSKHGEVELVKVVEKGCRQSVLLCSLCSEF